MSFLPYSDADAVLSDDGVYRYWLCREWKPRFAYRNGRGGLTLFIMLNPSTADASVDDPTIRRCMGFVHSWGHNRLEVVNLFAYRTSDPKKLLNVGNPVGLRNDSYILKAADNADIIVCAWGTMGWIDNRAKDVRALLSKYPLRALGFTRGGHPKHPLYLPSSAKLENFE